MLVKNILLLIAVVRLAVPAEIPDRVLRALAEVETGARKPQQCAADFRVGASGEVGRYQIKPALLLSSERNQSTNPDAMKKAARRILSQRVDLYIARRGKKPDLVAVGLLWNAPAYPLGWRREPTPKVCLERAQRFANLASAQ
jgi:hypothetical protein